jgi:hypothetical protein
MRALCCTIEPKSFFKRKIQVGSPLLKPIEGLYGPACAEKDELSYAYRSNSAERREGAARAS